MSQSSEHLDPRVKRTRQLLVQAFFELLSAKDFEAISVQDIAEKATVLCDYLEELGRRCPKHRRQFEPMVESKVKALVRDVLLSSLMCPNHPGEYPAPELVATMASWAMFAAALEWSRNKLQPSEDFAVTVLPLITATLRLPVVPSIK